MATDVQDVLGASVKRVEDPRFITGKGRYLDDIKLTGMAHLAILRSPYAHANIRSIDTSRGEDDAGRPRRDRRRRHPVQPAADGLAGRRRVGHPEQRQHAADPRHRLRQVDRRGRRRGRRRDAGAGGRRARGDPGRLRAAAGGRRRREGDPAGRAAAPRERAEQRRVRLDVGDKDGTEKAFAEAEVVVKQRLVNHRLIPNPMEVRGDIGLYNPGTDEYTVWMSSQTPHIQRLLLTAFVTGIPEHKVRCISPDVGGAFGSKIFCYADMALVMWASKLIGGRPVKWVESRRESYGSTIHGRDHITYVEIAGKRDGEVTGLRVKTFANLGGRLSTIGPGIPTTLYGRVLSGCYKIPNVYCEVTGVYTNTTFVDAYRGAGRPEATYVIERAMDLFADEIGMDPAAIRRKNFLPPDAFPYDNPSGLLDRGQRREDLRRLGQLRARPRQGARDGRLRRPRGEEGRGDRAAASSSASGCRPTSRSAASRPSKWIGAVGEGWGAAMWESSNIKVHLTGKVVVTMGTQPQGQGHETTYAQIVSHELGIPMDDIVVQHSDTQGTPFGYGSYGSRTSNVGSTARRSRPPTRSGRRPGATPPTCSRRRPTTSRSIGAEYRVKGSPEKKKTLQEIAFALDLGVRRRPGHGAVPRRDRLPRHARTARSRSGPTSRSSRSTRRPARSTSCATSRSTTSARRSTR